MRILIGACALLWSVSVLAVDDPVKGPALTLGEAVALVLERNPRLKAVDFDLSAAAERIRQGSQSTPWRANVALENLAGSGRASGIGDLETTLSLGRVLELGGKRRLRGERAQHELGLLRHELDAQRLDILAQVTQRFVELARVQAERKLYQDRVQLMRNTLAEVEKRFQLGRAPAAEFGRAQIGLAQAELALEETEHQRANGRRQLSMLWGDLEPGFGVARADLFALNEEQDFATLEHQLEANPTLVSLATEARLAKTGLEIARARGRSDLNLNAGLRHFNAEDDIGLVLSLSVPLGSEGRAQPYRAEANSRMQGDALRAQEQRLALRTTLYAAYQERLHARDRLRAYQERIIPAAEKALKDYGEGYRAGRYSFLELTSAQEILLEARREALSAAADHHKIGAEIVRLIGATPESGVGQ